MAMDSRRRKIAMNLPLAVDLCCDEEAGENESRYTSPESPSNLRYARSHAELAGRPSPPLSAGVSFTEELETEDYYNWD